MRKTEILGKYENLPPTNIYSGRISQEPYITSKQKNYQKFYNTLKDISNENRVNAVYIQIKELQYNIEKDFNMIFNSNWGIKFFRNAFWELEIRSTTFSIHNQKTHKAIFLRELKKLMRRHLH